MTPSKKDRPSDETLRGWMDLAAELGARLKLRDRSAWSLISRVAHAAWARTYYAEQQGLIRPDELDPSVEDVLDALRLIPAAQNSLNRDERDLIRAARERGASWEQIGVALGIQPSGAKQAARGRYERLGGIVAEAVAGAAAERAATLIQPARSAQPVPVVQVPADDWPLPGERQVPGVAFVAPALFDPSVGGHG